MARACGGRSTPYPPSAIFTLPRIAAACGVVFFGAFPLLAADTPFASPTELHTSEQPPWDALGSNQSTAFAESLPHQGSPSPSPASAVGEHQGGRGIVPSARWIAPPDGPSTGWGGNQARQADFTGQADYGRLRQTVLQAAHRAPFHGTEAPGTNANASPDVFSPDRPLAEAVEGANLPVSTDIDEIDFSEEGAAEGDRVGEGPKTPLAPPGAVQHSRPRSGLAPSGSRGSPASAVTTIGSSLAIVLGLFLIFAWLLRRGTPGLAAPLPTEVVEVLGRAPLAGRQQIHLLRLGRKLLLVSVSATGAETLAEVTDPDEVDHLAGLCRATLPNSTSGAFRQVFQQFAREPASSAGSGLPGPRTLRARHLGRTAREVEDVA